MREKIFGLFFLLSLTSCNSYSEYILKDDFKNNYQVKLLKNNQSIIYLVENGEKVDSAKITYKKESLKLQLSKIKFNSSTRSNQYVKVEKKIKTILFTEDFSNNLHFKSLENTRFAIVDNNLSTIDSVWLPKSRH